MKYVKIINDEKILYRLKMIIIGVFTILLIGLSAPQYTSQSVYILLTSFSVYTWQIKEKIFNLNKNV